MYWFTLQRYFPFCSDFSPVLYFYFYFSLVPLYFQLVPLYFYATIFSFYAVPFSLCYLFSDKLGRASARSWACLRLSQCVTVCRWKEGGESSGGSTSVFTASYAIFLEGRFSKRALSCSREMRILILESMEPLFLDLCSLKMRLASSVLLLRLPLVVSSSPPSRIFSREADFMRKCLLVRICGSASYRPEGALIIQLSKDYQNYQPATPPSLPPRMNYNQIMGILLSKCLCSSVYVINKIPVIRGHPTKCLSGQSQTVSFQLEDDQLSIWRDRDQLQNSESQYAIKSQTIILPKGSKGIKTRTSAIAKAVSDLIRQLDDRGFSKIVFAQPRTSEENRLRLFQAIITGLYDFTERLRANYLASVYIPWDSMKKDEMVSTVHCLLDKWRRIA